MGVFQYLREKKEFIKAQAKAYDMEKDYQRQKEIKEIKEKRAMLKSKAELSRVRQAYRDERHPFIKRLATKMSENVKKRQAEAKGATKDIFETSTGPFSNSLFGPKPKHKKATIKRKVITYYE